MAFNIFGILKQKREEINSSCDDLIAQCNSAISDSLKILPEDKRAFADVSAAKTWEERYEDLFDSLESADALLFRIAANYNALIEKKDVVFQKRQELPKLIGQHNEKAADLRINDGYALIGKVEGQTLDRQQMTCIVKDVHTHLVVAGAGTGKTTTIIGKIKYLLNSHKCRPEDILVLSFTNASAAEMSGRIKNETGYDIAASTFHKLGINIITQVDQIKPKITSVQMKKYIRDVMGQYIQNDSYLESLITYFTNGRVLEESEFDFSSQSEYDKYLQSNPPTTLKNEIVKSYGEMDIANFLFKNGINYIYEHPYEIDTRTTEYGMYHPDFYLPDHHVYIEYFGIDRNGNVPSYFSGRDGKTASETYREGMEWKKQLHKENSTTLISCYSYEKWNGTLIPNLERNLKENGVELKPLSNQEVWNKIVAEKETSTALDGLIELIETLINLIKSNNYTVQDVRELSIKEKSYKQNIIILDILEPVYNAYCQYLDINGEIDFNDMINLAARYVKEGTYVNPYSYVIVDEYQDIAKSRYTLLHNMRDSKNFELFCVGDDWQSIYRFAGSDIGYILNFEKYWGPSAVSKIETTYRFPQKLINISGDFVMKNPRQIKKSISGRNDDNSFPMGETIAYGEKHAAEAIGMRLDDLSSGSSVFFIGRYSFDIQILDGNKLFTYAYNNAEGMTDVTYFKRRDLKIRFLTAHKSKGLQADYVFIINNKNDRMGFPSKVQDAPVLNLLLDNCDQYPHAEERRLFYVAMTRAKKKVFLLVLKGRESEFVKELDEKYSKDFTNEFFTCPKCGGHLVKRSGPYGEFWGCSNYSTSKCTYKRNIPAKKES